MELPKLTDDEWDILLDALYVAEKQATELKLDKLRSLSNKLYDHYISDMPNVDHVLQLIKKYKSERISLESEKGTQN